MATDDRSPNHSLGRLPDFIAVGPTRTGTTWLHGVLYHRACLPNGTKETHFFDMFYAKGLNWYRSYFGNCATDAMIGEVAPTYFALDQVRERIACALPGCRIICTFRDPVARAWSWYRVLHREGRIRGDFLDETMRGSETQLREANRYTFHLRDWQRRFGAENVGVFLYDDLRADPQAFADSVLEFLGLPPVNLSDVAAYLERNEADEDCRMQTLAYGAWRFRLWLKSMRADRTVNRLERLGLWRFSFGGGDRFAQLSAESERRLREFFRPEVEELEEMLGRDLSAWKTPSPPGDWRKIEAAV